MSWFWENLDRANYSLWRSDFKYQDENTVDFMVNNKARGFMQRCDEIRKYAFGTLLILDSKEKLGHYRLQGVWLLRGDDIRLMEEANPEYNTFTWTKLDLEAPDTKQLVEDYWCSNGEKECDGFVADD